MAVDKRIIGTLEALVRPHAIPIFYSTNAWVKYYIHERYRDGRHYVWCSEGFSGPRRSTWGMPPMPRSSSPLEIYRELLGDVISSDSHSSKITQQQHSLNSLAQKWLSSGEIGNVEFKEIFTLVNLPISNIWRPVIYVIPQHAIHPSRVQVVHPAARAGVLEREYIIHDLLSSEFDVLEPAKC
jgi:hypothetical protein